MSYHILPGKTFPLGSHYDGSGTHFAIFSAHAEEIPADSSFVQLFVPSFFDEGTIDAVIAEWERRGRSEPAISVVDEALIGDYTDPAYFIDYWHLSEVGSDAVSTAVGRELCPIIGDDVRG